MARILTNGFELNSMTQGMEWFGSHHTGSIVTSTVNNSTYAYRNNPSAASQRTQMGFPTTGIKTAYARFHYYAVTAPAANSQIFAFTDSSLLSYLTLIRGTGSGIKVMNSANTQVGSSYALSTGQWYLIEVGIFSNSTTGTIDVKVDGSTIVSVTGENTNGADIRGIALGASAALTHEYYIDNLAVNDTSGSYQNSWVGPGYVICLRPNAAGDSTNYTRGGTDSGTNYGQVDEVTPNDITDYVVSSTTNHIDMYNVGASGIGSGDTVNVVHVGYRIANITSDGIAVIEPRIIKTSGGTVTTGTASGSLSSTVWRSNGGSTTAFNPYPINAYQDPDAAAWTQSTLDSMQIGFKTTNGGTNGIAVSAVWAMVDYTPAAAASFNAAWNASANTTIQSGAMQG